jgi:hypothetical protein
LPAVSLEAKQISVYVVPKTYHVRVVEHQESGQQTCSASRTLASLECAVSFVLPVAPLADLTVTIRARHPFEHSARGFWWVKGAEKGHKLPLRFA